MTGKAFMAELITETEQNPFNHAERVWQNKACFDCRLFGDAVRFSVRSLRRREGHGSEALNWLCGLADRHKVALTGDAAPFGGMRPRLTRSQLKKWYARHGFAVSQNGALARLPKGEKN